MAAEDLIQLFVQKLSLSETGLLNSIEFATNNSLEHQKVVGAVKSLQSMNMVVAEQIETKRLELTGEGKQIVENGSHEYRIWEALPETGGIEQPVLMKKISDENVAKLGFTKAMSNKWIAIDKSSGKPLVIRKATTVVDEVRHVLQLVQDGSSNKLTDQKKQELKKRKLIAEINEKSYDVRKAENFSTTIAKPETDISAEMIRDGSWKSKQFKDYNFNAKGIPPECGHLHPLLKVREQFRQIFFELGFEEMPTNNYVESSFWCFDALFVPQKHPARDMQDTFFLSEPAECLTIPSEYMERIKETHVNGGSTGSTGYSMEWKESEAKKNVLRTHTTAVSARMLYKVGQEYQQQLISAGGDKSKIEFKPVKFFSIDKVFRNETLDATHLAEFNQIEGVVADQNLSLGHLMGLIKEFFAKLGIHDLRFKPTYNPYTEPSMEMYSWHSGLNKWVEIGNSGLFRPEMIRPMGLPEDVNVLGWGLSLERPTMIKYGYDNIRDLVGHKVDLQMVYDSPCCIWEERKQSYSKVQQSKA
ncbi:hypothetical protein RDWZM_001212 [Blomia tropicalis]|uniref:phenylalanine--tRNA ligase n=1 Tax=Blomia tropicalis TaxID=40697 RepID=A0A9Q0MBT4_BLOTA|nr:hypothetical protein RDWZM_001212 [Blomia tropicalis]